MRSIATVLTLKSKFSGKFQRFNTINRFSIKMKNCKTLYEVQTASHIKEIIQPQCKCYLLRQTETCLLENL